MSPYFPDHASARAAFAALATTELAVKAERAVELLEEGLEDALVAFGAAKGG